MPPAPHDTCWTMLRAASAGDASAKSVFARSYTTPIRAYLGHRWRDNGLAASVDDAYLRYMDDFVLFADSKSWLRQAHAEVARHLGAVGLELKARATVLAPARQGLPFLGFRIYRGTTRIRPDNLRRTRARLRQRKWQFDHGVFDEDRLAECTRSVTAHLTHGNTLALRRSWFHNDETAEDRQLLQPRQPRRQLQQPSRQRAVGQPQQQRTDDPQQQPSSAKRCECRRRMAAKQPMRWQPGLASRQDVASPDRDGRLAAPSRRAP